MLRLPDGMRDRLKAAAAENNRSLNAEIVSRLELTLERMSDVNAFGMDAFARRLEASLAISEEAMHKLIYELRAAGGYLEESERDTSLALEKFAEDEHLSKGSAVHAILTDWLREKGYLPK
ncbi:MAG: Arc family DNA-binding protein [Pseudomonadota bacterium]